MLKQSIRHCISRLGRFEGRDSPGQFWPFAGVVIGGSMAVWIVAFVISFVGMFGKIQQFAREHPDQVTIDQGPGHYSIQVHGNHPELMPDFGMFLILMALICLVIAFLLAAGVVRRLHDSDRRGWYALIPLSLLFSGFAIMSRAFGLMQSNDPVVAGKAVGLIFLGVANNLAYLATLGVLVYFLVRKGTPGPNRFGEPPA